jgi:23S rRNA (pseudouridine1915-N3)-methyltransferase
MKKFTLLAVGQLKSSPLKSLQEEYLKRLKKPPCRLVECRACPENPQQEGSEILKNISGNDGVVLLDQRGKLLKSSEEFSHFFYRLYEKNNPLVFVIGGALGAHESIKGRAQETISLSTLTYAHELCRIIFLEQLYRAQCVRQGHPYHQD